MLSTRDIRRRIRSISSTAQITKAMQMVAASKMRKAQQAALAGRPFVRLLYRMQRKATTQAVDFTHPLLEVREVRKRAVILVGGDKGLCGALNSNLFRVAAQFDPQSTVFITAGRKAAQFVARTGRQLAAEFTLRRHAAIRGGQGHCRLCPRPVPEGGGGPGPDCRHALRQHAHPAAASPSSFCRWAKSRGSSLRERNPKRSWRPRRPSSSLSPARKPFWAISSRITSTFTFIRSC